MLTLPHPVPLHDLVAIIHHLVVDSLAIATNFILIAAIIVASPPSLKSYKLILLCCALVDVIAGVTQLGAMSRVVPAVPVLAHFYVGPCTIVSGKLLISYFHIHQATSMCLGRFCYFVEEILFATANQTLILLVVSFCFRIYVLRRELPSARKTVSICAASFIPNVIFLIAFSTAQDDSKQVVNALRISRPFYSVESYVIEGYLDMFSLEVMVFIGVICAPIFPAYILIFALRRILIRSIGVMSDKMSNKTKEMHLTLCKVLFLQSSLPSCYFLPFIFFFQCIFSESLCSPTIEHAMLETGAYIALIAPLISLFYIKPYRKFALSLLPRRAFNQESKHSTNSQTAHVI